VVDGLTADLTAAGAKRIAPIAAYVWSASATVADAAKAHQGGAYVPRRRRVGEDHLGPRTDVGLFTFPDYVLRKRADTDDECLNAIRATGFSRFVIGVVGRRRRGSARDGRGFTSARTLNAKLNLLYLTAFRRDESQRHRFAQRDGTTYVSTGDIDAEWAARRKRDRPAVHRASPSTTPDRRPDAARRGRPPGEVNILIDRTRTRSHRIIM